MGPGLYALASFLWFSSGGKEMEMFNAVKVFSATKFKDREDLGEKISDWIGWSRPEIVDKVVMQSSDSEFHCLTVVIFYKEKISEKNPPSKRR